MAIHSPTLNPGSAFSGEFLVRPAIFEDIDTILSLWQAMMQAHEAGDERIRLAPSASSAYRAYVGYHLANSESLVLSAEALETRRVVGFGLVTISRNLPMFLPARYGYLSDLAVSPQWRRQGIGATIVRRMGAWLREHDVHTIQLQFYAFNTAGAAFWEAMGFKPFYHRMLCQL